MEITELTVRLLLLFFPGLITTAIVHALTTSRDWSTAEVLGYAFGFGLLNYLVLAMLAELVNLLPGDDLITVQFFNVLLSDRLALQWGEILAAAVVAVPVGLLGSAAHNRKWLWRAAGAIGVSRKFGHVGVWEYFFDSPDVVWVVVRDLEHDLVYNGWIEGFSDTVEEAEMFLRDVIVASNSTGENLYAVKGLYLSRERNGLLIELPQGGYSSVETSGEAHG